MTGCSQCEFTDRPCPEGRRLHELRCDALNLWKAGDGSEWAYRYFRSQYMRHVYGVSKKPGAGRAG